MKRKCQRYQRGALSSKQAFSFFNPINVSWISRFLEVSQVKVYCQRCQHGAENSMRAFLFFGQRLFSSISRTGEREVSPVQRTFSDQYVSIFVFRSKKNFFDISLSGCFIGERKVSVVPTRCPEEYTIILVFRYKYFFFDISLR